MNNLQSFSIKYQNRILLYTNNYLREINNLLSETENISSSEKSRIRNPHLFAFGEPPEEETEDEETQKKDTLKADPEIKPEGVITNEDDYERPNSNPGKESFIETATKEATAEEEILIEESSKEEHLIKEKFGGKKSKEEQEDQLDQEQLLIGPNLILSNIPAYIGSWKKAVEREKPYYEENIAEGINPLCNKYHTEHILKHCTKEKMENPPRIFGISTDPDQWWCTPNHMKQLVNCPLNKMLPDDYEEYVDEKYQ